MVGATNGTEKAPVPSAVPLPSTEPSSVTVTALFAGHPLPTALNCVPSGPLGGSRVKASTPDPAVVVVLGWVVLVVELDDEGLLDELELDDELLLEELLLDDELLEDDELLLDELELDELDDEALLELVVPEPTTSVEARTWLPSDGVQVSGPEVPPETLSSEAK